MPSEPARPAAPDVGRSSTRPRPGLVTGLDTELDTELDTDKE
ncbi:hypothetical protein ACFY4C_11345 [Actinomadura viridis]